MQCIFDILSQIKYIIKIYSICFFFSFFFSVATRKLKTLSVVHRTFLLDRAALNHYYVIFKDLTEILHFTGHLKNVFHSQTLNFGNHTDATI